MASFNPSLASNHTALHLATLQCHALSPSCPIEATVYGYQPSLPANTVFAAVFGVCFIAQLVLGWLSGAWLYSRFVAVACLIETIGYAGRLMLWSNPWSSVGFKIQVSMLIMAPAFLAASVYITLRVIIRELTPEDGDLHRLSPLSPVVYTPLFMACDAVCGLLQAAGGAIAASAGVQTTQLQVGGNVMLGGIVAQVAVSLSFIALVATYAVRVYQHRNELEDSSKLLLRSTRFRVFLFSLSLGFWAVFVRCIYRIAEMAGGWGNPVMRDQTGFITLDGVMCAIAAISLTCCHPYWAFPSMGRPNTKRPTKEITDA